ncbi:putative steroid dehydrogenase 2 [Centruroides sculpturatus]|uniref:putative steroid dehydrogenase 2 n=1 Tax=Centruroides sculpturatus TaxID=218467 RepID=UPI000C6CCF71|nr:putative steroid dehydrogenase 2 [Centruroides sculpturatus]
MLHCMTQTVYFFAAVGVAFIIFIFVYSFHVLVLGAKLFVFSKFLSIDIKKYGNWAVVIGSTDGIGKFYAKELARRGLNIILVSRNAEKLQKTAEDLQRFWITATKCEIDCRLKQ